MKKNEHKNKGNFGRAFLYKIWKSTLGFRKILQDSLRGRGQYPILAVGLLFTGYSPSDLDELLKNIERSL